MEYKTIIYEKKGNVAYVTLNRPENMNTWDFPGQGGMCDDFYNGALKEAEEDDDVKVVVIKGAGRCFSAGHDVKTVGHVYGMGSGKAGERRASQRARLKVDRKWFEAHRYLMLYPKLTVAQVHGICSAEGFAVAMFTDMIIAAEDARIGDMTSRIGFGGVGLSEQWMLMLSIGIKRARSILLQGTILDGKQAEQLGIVARAVPREQLEEEVDKVVKVLLLQPRDGIAIGKAFTELMYNSLGVSDGVAAGYVSHSFLTNMRFEPDEYNFLKERRDKGVSEAVRGLRAPYDALTGPGDTSK